MLDIKFIKDNKEIVQMAVKNKNRDVDIDELLKRYEERKELRTKLDDLNQKRNEAAKTRNVEEGKKLKEEGEKIEKDFSEAERKFLSLMLKVPNIPSPDTPVGNDESANKVILTWGNKPSFEFAPWEHFELGADLNIIDTETAAEVTGARFSYIKGDLVLLQFALLQFSLEILGDSNVLEKIAKEGNHNVSTKPFIPIIPPHMVKTAVQNRMARFMNPEEHYIFPEDEIMLIGSAEHTLGPMHMDEVFDEKELPIRYVGYSPAYRREAGTYGKDMKGILRVHQFDKVEMESFALPENSIPEQEFIVSIQQYILRLLNLPYQVVLISTGDMGFPDYRQIDIEVWLPGQNKFREITTSDNNGGFQSRRLNTRVKRTDGRIEHVHMNDATAIAMGRMMIAIMENYQNEDGSITIPNVLRKFMGGREKIVKLAS